MSDETKLLAERDEARAALHAEREAAETLRAEVKRVRGLTIEACAKIVDEEWRKHSREKIDAAWFAEIRIRALAGSTLSTENK